jgi:hypothetical protein
MGKLSQPNTSKVDTVREDIRVQPQYIGGYQLTARHGSEGKTCVVYIVDVHCYRSIHPFSCYRGQSGRGVRLTIHPRLVPGFRITELRLSTPHLPS